MRALLRRAWPVALPLVGGLAGALLLSGSTAEVRVNVSVALLTAEAGLLAALAVAAILMLRNRFVRARAEAATVAAVAERAEHRRFLHRLDHELKNPLTAIRAALANLGAAPPPPQAAHAGPQAAHATTQAAHAGPQAAHATAQIAAIDGQVLRLARLVADLRKLAEIADRPLAMTAVSLDALLREAAATTADLPGGDDRKVSVSVPRVRRSSCAGSRRTASWCWRSPTRVSAYPRTSCRMSGRSWCAAGRRAPCRAVVSACHWSARSSPGTAAVGSCAAAPEPGPWSASGCRHCGPDRHVRRQGRRVLSQDCDSVSAVAGLRRHDDHRGTRCSYRRNATNPRIQGR